MIDGGVTFNVLLFAAAVFLLAGTVKGVLGIGLPTISISMLAQFVDPRVSIAFLLFPALITNAWQIYRGGNVLRSARRLWPFVTCMAVVMFISSLFAARASTPLLVAGIGIMVVLWTVSGLIRSPPKVPEKFDRPLQVFCGAVAGVIGGLTAIWSPPMVMYLISIRCEKEDFVRFTGFIIICGTVPLTLGYVVGGLLDRSLAIASALMIVPTLLGFSIGEYLRRFLGGQQFQKAVLVVFCLMGLNLIRRAFFLS